MSKEINLITRKEKNISPTNKRIVIFRYISYGTLFLVALCSVGILILKAMLPTSQLAQAETQARSQLNAKSQDGLQLVYTKERLDTIDEILEKRPNVTGIIDAIMGQNPNNLTVSTLNLDTKKIVFNISSTDANLLRDYLTNLVDKTRTNKSFSKVTLESFGIETKAGKYSASLTLELK